MTRSEAYNEGFHEGRRWAEADIRDGVRVDPEPYCGECADIARAVQLGACRGYRDTWARYDAGTLTPEMFELAPIGPR